ncbi:MAG TPA: MFS transporter [Planctomycetota bacterium]|nr:MFS transporter [Planctomycetota bacterium]
MADPASPSPRRTSVGVIFMVLFLDLVGFSILFPLYAHMLEHYGALPGGALGDAMAWVGERWPRASPEQRAALFGGLLGAGYSLLQFVSAPFWGRLSDRWGRRPILLLSVGGSCAAYALWLVSGSFAVLLISRAIAGLMGGSVVCANAAVADVTESPKDRARGMGLVGMAFGLGFILGPVIGGVSSIESLRIDGSPALRDLGVNPFSTPALVALTLALINLVWAFLRFDETLPAERRGRPSATRTANPLRLFASDLGPGVVRLNAAFCFHTLIFAGMESTLVFLTQQELALEPQDNAWLFAAMGLTSALTQGLIFRRFAPRIGGKPLALIGLGLLIPGFALLGALDYAPSHALLWCGVIVLAAGTGLIFPALSTLISLASDERNQGLAFGTFRSAGSLGRALGPLIGAAVYFAWRPAGPYLCGAVAILLPLWLVWRLRVAKPA